MSSSSSLSLSRVIARIIRGEAPTGETVEAPPRARGNLQVLLEQAEKEPWAEDLFTFLREFEKLCAERPRIGSSKNYREDLIFLSQALHLEHAPATIRRIEAAPRQDRDGPLARLEGYFLGLLGPSGPLPLAWTEYIWARSNGVPHPDRIAPNRRGISLNRRDTSLKDFLNIFNHRLLSFFYRAWAATRKAPDYDRPEEAKFLSFIGSFFGLGEADLRSLLFFDSRQAIYFAGHLTNRSRYPGGLEAIISDYLDCPVCLVENKGIWLDIPLDQWSVLGSGSGMGTLGAGLPMGARFWDRQLSFELLIGPLPLSTYNRFAPDDEDDKSVLPALRDMVALYTHRELFGAAVVILEKSEVPPPILGSGVRLGFSTWLHSGAPANHPEELRIELN